MGKIWKSIIKVFFDMVCCFITTVRVELQRISKVFSVFIPLIALYQSETVLQFIVTYLSYMLLANYINRLGKELNGKDVGELPIRDTRYVIEEDGMYYVKPQLLDEALEYLGELEDYFDRTYIRNKKYVDRHKRK